MVVATRTHLLTACLHVNTVSTPLEVIVERLVSVESVRAMFRGREKSHCESRVER